MGGRKRKSIYLYSVINICEILNCGTQKACKLLDELEIFGALERRRQGLGKPNKLYLKESVLKRYPHKKKSKHIRRKNHSQKF